jgi:hypothetical protein
MNPDNQGVVRQFPWLGKPGIFRPNRESKSAEPGSGGSIFQQIIILTNDAILDRL